MRGAEEGEGGTRRTLPSHRPSLRNPKLGLSGFGKKLQSTLGSVFARITRALQARSLFLRQDPVFQKIFSVGDEGPTPQIFLAVLGPPHWIGLGRLLDSKAVGPKRPTCSVQGALSLPPFASSGSGQSKNSTLTKISKKTRPLTSSPMAVAFETSFVPRPWEQRG